MSVVPPTSTIGAIGQLSDSHYRTIGESLSELSELSDTIGSLSDRYRSFTIGLSDQGSTFPYLIHSEWIRALRAFPTAPVTSGDRATATGPVDMIDLTISKP